MPADLVVRGRRVVTPAGVAPASILIQEGKIAAVGAEDDLPAGMPVIEAGEAVVMPGLVDTHVHVNEPGRTDWEGFETATRAAAAGGITTLVDMPLNSIPATTTREALREMVIHLPALAPQAVEKAPDASANQRPGSELAEQPLRVLIVDDNEDSAESLALLMRLAGHEVRTAYEGLSALTEARRFMPDMVVLDIGLPKMDGYQVARRLRQEPGGDRLMLLALTGYGQEEDRRRSREAGFDHYLVKPVDLERFQELLDSATRIPTRSAAPTTDPPAPPARRAGSRRGSSRPG